MVKTVFFFWFEPNTKASQMLNIQMYRNNEHKYKRTKEIQWSKPCQKLCSPFELEWSRAGLGFLTLRSTMHRLISLRLISTKKWDKFQNNDKA